MNEDQLKRHLNSIGKGCFINYYDDFNNFVIQNYEVADKLKRENQYTERASNTRVSNARSIINHGMTKRALEIIISSQVDGSIKIKAKKILANV